MSRTCVVVALVIALPAAACRNDNPADDQRTDSMTSDEVRAARADWPDGLAELVDSANQAFSAHDFARASELYRRASVRGDDIPAVWFGIYMTEHARGNAAAADSALARVQQLAPGATLLRNDTTRVNPHR
jgi:hypothetical protein